MFIGLQSQYNKWSIKYNILKPQLILNPIARLRDKLQTFCQFMVLALYILNVK